MKVCELTGTALDWAVARAEGNLPEGYVFDPTRHCYSLKWALGGPIIEREKISIEWTGEDWMGYIWHDREFFAPTPLIAAMRSFVASKLGDEIEVPGGLK